MAHARSLTVVVMRAFCTPAIFAEFSQAADLFDVQYGCTLA